MPNDTRRTLEDIALAKTVLDNAATKRKLEEIQRTQKELRDRSAFEERQRKEQDRKEQLRRDDEERSRKRKQDQAERDRLEEIKFHTDNPKLLEAREHYKISKNCINAGLIDEAITELKKAIECTPDFSDAYLQLSASYLTKIQIIAKESPLAQLLENQEVFKFIGEADINLEKAKNLKGKDESLTLKEIQQVIQDLLKISYQMGLGKIKDKWLGDVYKFTEYKINMYPLFLSPIIQSFDCLLFIHEGERMVSLLTKCIDGMPHSFENFIKDIKDSPPKKIIKSCNSVKEDINEHLKIIEQIKEWLNEQEFSSKIEILELLENEKENQTSLNDKITRELQEAEASVRTAKLIQEQKQAEEQKRKEKERVAQEALELTKEKEETIAKILSGSIIGTIIVGIGGTICGVLGSALQPNGTFEKFISLVIYAIVGFFDVIGLIAIVLDKYVKHNTFSFLVFIIIFIILVGICGVGGDPSSGALIGGISGAVGSALVITIDRMF